MTKRIHSIDLFRVIAIVFVIIAHTQPFQGVGEYGNTVYFVIDTIGQFDLPFFFMASGYFLAKKLDPESIKPHLHSTARKLSSLYLFGIILSLAVVVTGDIVLGLIQGQTVTSQIITRLIEALSPLGLFYYGNSVLDYLWFLPALLFGICFLAIFVTLEKNRYIIPVAASLHLIGLIDQNFPMLLDVPFPTRDALFYGFFYLALGFWIRKADWSPDADRSRVYLGTFGFFLFVQLAEQYVISFLLLDATLGQEVYPTSYTISTIFLSFSLFAYALSNPSLGKETILPDLGGYVVGIYLIHLPLIVAIDGVSNVLMAVGGIDFTSTIIWHLISTPLVFALSLVAYLLAAKIGIIELGGSHIPRLSRIRAQLTSETSKSRSASD